MLHALSLLSALIVVVCGVPSAAEDLFNGSDLTGWEGDPQYWSVRDGAIVGQIPPGTSLIHNTWLVWQGGQLADFDLRLQFRLRGLPAANSGIQFRCQVDSIGHVSGYQADLDMGATWLGRIYDEHGRALLVERGTRVLIAPDGSRRQQTFAPAAQYSVLFRENDWNDYRIVAEGPHVAVYVNGTLFSELYDEQRGEADFSGQLAFQLHSGPETLVEFRRIQLQTITADQQPLTPFPTIAAPVATAETTGEPPTGTDNKPLNLGFEQGSLEQWTALGDAFLDQPVNADGIAQRWPGQVSGKQGEFFIGGYEIVRDAGRGTLTSPAFTVTAPWGSFLVGGGKDPSTRVEVLLLDADDQPVKVHLQASGRDREQMHRVAVDLRDLQQQRIRIRLVDENPGGWGHLNFDDFRFHESPPSTAEQATAWRSINNPLLAHLVPNPVPEDQAGPAVDTLRQMSVPPGFSADLIAAEPQLHQPMAFTFDARGRLWVVEGHCYPQRRPDGEGLDRILIFTDADHDGHFETQQVFCEGLNLVSGMEVGHGGVWVGAAPHLLFIPDVDGDDRPDAAAQVLLDGFDYADTHETLNSFQWGPDGWLYGNQGVFNNSLIGAPGAPAEARLRLSAGVWRYHPLRHEFEIFAHGGSNQWGLDYDDHGQWFMTHCRSFFGGGLTTHVVQGGHYWNQSNNGYAAFVSPQPLPGMPWMKNYLLASARYGHGEGGAGKPGTAQVYGGHSHVGTMIYLGDNWPEEYRDHLFTHNLHGHQINHQVNVPLAGGFQTLHAGQDMLFCGDRQYIGIDLQYGPDGAVYLSDWYDPRHCHNPNAEQWDRGNGRMYRLKYDATWKPADVNLTAMTDLQLAELQLHQNDWYVRMARLQLAERAAQRPLSVQAIRYLQRMVHQHPQPPRRLRALWALHVTEQLDDSTLQQVLTDTNEYVRGWAIQLGVEHGATAVLDELSSLAANDASQFVARSLASALPHLPVPQQFGLAHALAMRSDLDTDRDLPSLLWFALAPLVAEHPAAAAELAAGTPSVAIRDLTRWYMAQNTDAGRATLLDQLAAAAPAEQKSGLQLLELALRGRRGVAAPAAWRELSTALYDADDAAVRNLAESIGAAFGDSQLTARLQQRLRNPETDIHARRAAITVLAGDRSEATLQALLLQLPITELNAQVITALASFDSSEVPNALLQRFADQPAALQEQTLTVLSSRAAWAGMLLDAVAAGTVQRGQLTSFHIRQMTSAGNEALNERIRQEWGELRESSAELTEQIQELSAAWKAAPLWAYDGNAGRQHFQKLCAQCHLPVNDRPAIAPALAGTSARGIDYLVENVINPNAVIGRNYQARIIITTSGRIVTGLIESETPQTITVRTLDQQETISRDDIDEMQISQDSFMPSSLLKTLDQRQRIELLKYVMGM